MRLSVLPLPAMAASLLLSLSAPTAFAATERDSAAQYAACIGLAYEDPAAGLDRARTWHDTGGGDPARHCEGVALISLGRYVEAGRLLEDLARTLDTGRSVRMRANALAQAGQAWMLAAKPARAEAAYGAALKLDEDDVELWIDRALARFDLGRYWEAIDDLNRASELAPERPDILVYRASAYRHVDAPEMARSDVNLALEHDSDHPEGLLERGIIRRLAGDDAGARADWIRLIDVAPRSPAADSARENLERMDVTGRAAPEETRQ